MIVTGAKCCRCGRIHDIKAKSFITISGNIYLGESGGLIGNNLDENNKVVNDVHFCFPDCFAKEIGLELKYPKQLT